MAISDFGWSWECKSMIDENKSTCYGGVSPTIGSRFGTGITGVVTLGLCVDYVGHIFWKIVSI